MPHFLVLRAWQIYCSRTFLIFLVFGGLAAAVNLAVGSALYTNSFMHMPYGVSVWIGAASGLLVNFGLNSAFNFRFEGRSAWGQFRTFLVIAGFGTLLTAFLADLFLWLIIVSDVKEKTAVLGISPPFAAHFCAVAVVTFYSYAAHKYFSFNIGIRSRLWGRK